MNKLEEAKDFIKSNGYFPIDKMGKAMDFTESYVNDLAEILVKFSESQTTLTLDSKIKDGEPVDYKNFKKSGMSLVEWEKIEAEAPTLRDCLRELEISQAGHKMKDNQIDQLTKERDELKESLDFQYKLVNQKQQQLQAEKQKNEELRKGIEEVTDLDHGHGVINQQWMFNHLKQLLNQ